MWHRTLVPGMAEVSPLCIGTVNYGTAMGESACFAQLDAFAAAGGNFADTAHVYGDWKEGSRGKSERVLGTWLRKSGAKGFVIATKGAHPRLDTMDVSRVTPGDIRRDVSESLENLGVDAIDLYFLHRDDPTVPVGEIIGLLETLRGEGMIRAYGCSNWTLPRIREAARCARETGALGFKCNQLLWSLADVRMAALGDPTMVAMDAETYAYHSETGLSAMAYMAAGKGYFARLAAGGSVPQALTALYGGASNRAIYEKLLEYAARTGKTVAQLSLMYLMAHPFASVPIASFDDAAQLQDALAACGSPPDEEMVAALHALKRFELTQEGE